MKLIDRSEREPKQDLFGTIRGKMVNEERDALDHGLECYILEYYDGQTELVPIVDVNDVWIVLDS